MEKHTGYTLHEYRLKYKSTQNLVGHNSISQLKMFKGTHNNILINHIVFVIQNYIADFLEKLEILHWLDSEIVIHEQFQIKN
jgi:hypothetical protein